MKVKCVDNWFYEHLLGRNKIYEVIRETNDNYVIMVDRVGYVSVSKDKFIIYKEDKMEEVRVVRKLEDLDGLENGMGLKIEWDRNLKTIDVNFGKIKMMYWSDTVLKYFGLELVLEQVKSLGFKFNYKPLRTVEEVLADIARLECERSQDCRTMILQDVNTNEYFATDNFRTIENDKKYFNEDIAYDLANELNEIIGVGK